VDEASEEERENQPHPQERPAVALFYAVVARLPQAAKAIFIE
jgi:hypothetical protein